MSEKNNRNVAIAVAVAIVAALVIVSLVVGGGVARHENANQPPPAISPDLAARGAPRTPPTTEPSSKNPAAPPVGGGGSISAGESDPIVSTASVGKSAGELIAFHDNTLDFQTSLPAADPRDPVIAYLRRDSEGYLEDRKKAAKAAFEHAKGAGAKPEPWTVQVEWAYTAKAGGIVSLAGRSTEDTGGVHPMVHFDALIAEQSTGKKLEVRQFFTPSQAADLSPALSIAICESVKAAKLKRIREASVNGEPIVCAGQGGNIKSQSPLAALAPSTGGEGKFGGMYIYYEPTAIGAYAEGPYRIAVRQEAFAMDLKPEYKPLFAGEPLPLKD